MYFFALSIALSVIIHTTGFVIATRLFGIKVKLITYGFGPVLFSKGLVEVRPLLLSGAVKLQQESDFEEAGYIPGQSYETKPRLIKVMLCLSGCLTLGLVSAALLGGMSFGFIQDAFSAFFLGALSPLDTGQLLLERFSQFVGAASFAEIFGFTALYFTVVNIVPMPPLNGGMALMEMLAFRDKEKVIMNSVGLVVWVAVLGSWAIAVLNYFM